MRNILAILGGAVVVSLLGSPAVAAADGKEVFLANKCNRCHSIETQEIEATIKSEKMKGPDLSDVGSRHDARWIEKFVKREVQLEDKNHKTAYKGDDKDLTEIAAWLAQLKKE